MPECPRFRASVGVIFDLAPFSSSQQLHTHLRPLHLIKKTQTNLFDRESRTCPLFTNSQPASFSTKRRLSRRNHGYVASDVRACASFGGLCVVWTAVVLTGSITAPKKKQQEKMTLGNFLSDQSMQLEIEGVCVGAALTHTRLWFLGRRDGGDASAEYVYATVAHCSITNSTTGRSGLQHAAIAAVELVD